MKFHRGAIGLTVVLAASCSANVKVEPVEVKPITMTIDINIKVDRQLDDFFDFEESLLEKSSVDSEGHKKGAEK